MNRRGFLKALLAAPAVIAVPTLAAKPIIECEVGIIESVRFIESPILPDITVVLQQYSCLYAFSDKTHELYSADGRPKRIKQSGYRAAKSWQRAR